MKAHRKLRLAGVGKVLRLVGVAAVLWLAAADLASACPSCKEALGSGTGGGDLVSGFFWSILFMLSMPFLLLGSFSLYFYYLIRKARLARATPQT
jgi:hypothetical protein